MEAFRLALRLGSTGLESDVWLSADGVPILDHRGRAIAALSVAAISGRLQPSRRRSVVSMLKAQARLIEQRLAQLGAGAAADRLAS